MCNINTAFDAAKEEARNLANTILPAEAAMLVRLEELQRDTTKIDPHSNKQMLSEIVSHKGVNSIKLNMDINLRARLQAASNKHKISQQALIRNAMAMYLTILESQS